MKIIFTTDAAHTLVDSADRSQSGIIETWGGQSVVQTEKRYGQASEVDFPRGNVGGEFVFTAGRSFNDYNGPIDAFVTAFSLLDQQGTLVVTPSPGDTTATMANAVLRDVHRVLLNGHRIELRYTFKITTITTP